MNLVKEYYQRNNINIPLVGFSKYGFLILKSYPTNSILKKPILWSFLRVESASRTLMPPCYLFERYSLKLDSQSKQTISSSLSYHGCMKYNSHFVSSYFNIEKRCYVELEQYEKYMFDLAKNINLDTIIADPDLVKISALQIFIIKNQKEICKLGTNKLTDISLVFQEKESNDSKLHLYEIFSKSRSMLTSHMRERWSDFNRILVERYNYSFADFLINTK